MIELLPTSQVPVQPLPPTAMPQSPQLWFTIYLALPIVVIGFFAIRTLIRQRDAMPLLFLVGGFFSVAFEPIVDVLGLCNYPGTGQWTVIAAFDHHVPLFVAFAYCWYVGGQAWIVLRMLQRRAPASSLWKAFGIFCLADAVLELPGLTLGVYGYYGNQPFEVFGFPLWWAPVNALMPVVSAMAVFFLKDFFTGWKVIAIVPLDVMADGVANATSGWPVWLALNSGGGYLVTYIGGTATILLAVLTMWIITKVATRTHAAAANKEVPVASAPSTPLVASTAEPATV